MSLSITIKDIFKRNLLLLISLFIMSFGVALYVRSMLGASPSLVIPLVWSLAGEDDVSFFDNSVSVPKISVGSYTFILNTLYVVLQIIILRRKYQLIQLLQFFMGFFFGFLMDVSMFLTNGIVFGDTILDYVYRIFTLLAGGLIMSLGLACEVKCKSVMMPGDGIIAAIACATGKEFGKVKIAVDVIIVSFGLLSCFLFFDVWRWDIFGVGTLLATIYVGILVRFYNRYLYWFDRIVDSK